MEKTGVNFPICQSSILVFVFIVFVFFVIHNEGLNILYRSPNRVRVIKSRRLRWIGHVPRMEEGRSSFKILTGIQKIDLLEGLGVDGRAVLEWA